MDAAPRTLADGAGRSSPARRRLLARHGPALAAAGLGLAWFLASGGGPALRPTNLGWILRDGADASTHWMGWAFFRLAPLQLPLGAAPGYAFPVGTSVALVDGIPLLGVLLRPLAPLLPGDFQYLGPWLGLCFALQGWFGARLTALFTERRAAIVAGGALLATSPVLLWRVGHEALCAHFLVLALLALGVRPAYGPARAHRTAWAVVGWSALAAAIHPTLTALVLVLGAACLARLWLHDRALSPAAAAVRLLLALAAAVTVFALLGYLGGAPLRAGGFGYFSSDLLTLVNPMGWSRVLPTFPTRPGQYEGFGYLGLGGLALLAFGAATAWRSGPRVPWRRLAPVLAATLLLAAFAVSTYVTLAGRKLFGTTDPFDATAWLVAPFRASGRFVWPLHYLVLTAAVAAACRAFPARSAAPALLLAGAVAVQVADLGYGRQAPLFGGELSALPAEAAAGSGIAHLAMVPPRLVDSDGRGCHPEPRAGDVAGAYLAYRLGATFNSGYLSRVDVRTALAACAAEEEAVRAGRLSPDTLYLVEPGWLRALPAETSLCGRLGTAIACVARGRTSPLARALASAPVR